MMTHVQRMPSRDFFMGHTAFASESPRLGQFEWIPAVVTGLLQAAPAGVAAYGAKRAADRAKQEKDRQKEAATVHAASDAAAQAKAQEDAKAQALLDQGLTPKGTPIVTNKVLGIDPMVLAVGGIGILGIGAALFMVLKK